jgi:hypothetical protein
VVVTGTAVEVVPQQGGQLDVETERNDEDEDDEENMYLDVL